MTGTNAALLGLILGAFTCSILPLSRTSAVDHPDRLFKYYHVYIMNEMPADSKEVDMHCWSSDDDLGVKTLARGDVYFFQFQVNFWKSTQFTCEAVWGYVRTPFTGFKASRDANRCEYNCFWSIREQGFFFSTDNSTWEFEFYCMMYGGKIHHQFVPTTNDKSGRYKTNRSFHLFRSILLLSTMIMSKMNFAIFIFYCMD